MFRAHGIVTIVASAWRSSKKRPKKPINPQLTTTGCGLPLVYSVHIWKPFEASLIHKSEFAVGVCAPTLSCRTRKRAFVNNVYRFEPQHIVPAAHFFDFASLLPL